MMAATPSQPTGLLSVICLSFSFFGCQYDPADSQTSSPESVFATVKLAERNRNLKEMWQCMTPNSIDIIAGQLALSSLDTISAFDEIQLTQFGGNDDKSLTDYEAAKSAIFRIRQILTEHGIDEKLTDSFLSLQGEVDYAEELKKAASPIKDKPTFLTEITEALDELSNSIPEQLTSASEGSSYRFDGILVDVKRNGDTAKGFQVIKDKDSTDKYELYFENRDGKWLIDDEKSYRCSLAAS